MPKLTICPEDITATITGPAKGGRMLDEKTLSRSFSFLTVADGVPAEVARILIWRTPARAYASVWLKLPNDWRAGHAMAGGYGYHRGSEAVGRALEAAGIKLDRDIGGSGETYYPAAIAAALRVCGTPGPVYFLQAY